MSVNVPSVQEAQAQIKAEQATVSYHQAIRFKAALEASLKKAVEDRAHCTSVEIPDQVDANSLADIRHSLQQKGYKVKIERRYGLIADNLVITPKIIFRLSW